MKGGLKTSMLMELPTRMAAEIELCGGGCE